MTRQEKGEYAHLQFQTRCLEKGIFVSKPMMEMRYDFIIDDHGSLKRVQVKFCDVRPSSSVGAYQVNLQSQGHKSKRLHYSVDEVDLVMIWIHKEKVIVCLTSELFAGKSGIVLRAEAPKNNQTNGIHLVRDLLW